MDTVPLTGGRVLATLKMLAAELENVGIEASMILVAQVMMNVAALYSQMALPVLLPTPAALKTASALPRRQELLCGELRDGDGGV